MRKQSWCVLMVLGLIGGTMVACHGWEEAPRKKPPKMTADVVYVPTPHDVVDKMLELVGVRKNDLVYDLGSGDGRIVIQAAKKYGCRAIGFEIDDDRVAESLENIKKEKIGHLVKIIQQDIYTVDLSPASVITSYLLPEMNKKLIPQFQKMKPGSRIVCHDYAIPGAKYEKYYEMTSNEDGVKHYIYVYKVPLRFESHSEE